MLTVVVVVAKMAMVVEEVALRAGAVAREAVYLEGVYKSLKETCL